VEIQIRTREMHQVAEEASRRTGSTKRQERGRPADQSFGVAAASLGMGSGTERIQGIPGYAAGRPPFRRGVRVYAARGRSGSSRVPRPSTRVCHPHRRRAALRGSEDHGASCRSRSELQNGDIVEIVTSPAHIPSKDWLKIVKTPGREPRSGSDQERERMRSVSLARSARKGDPASGKSPNQLSSPTGSDPLLRWSGRLCRRRRAVRGPGYGKVSPRQAVGRLLPPDEFQALTETEESREKKAERKASRARVAEEGFASADRDILVRFSKCCSPVPGDEIHRIHHRGRGRLDPHADCPNAVSLMADPERRSRQLGWKRKEPHQVKIRVEIGEGPAGCAAEITTAISSTNTNITQADIRVTEERMGVNTSSWNADLNQLQATIQAIRKVTGWWASRRVRSL